MILLGIVLLVLSALLPDWFAVPYGVEHALTVVGGLLIAVGLIVLILSLFGVTVGNRRYWF
jgi:uncharacterized membrane protein (DUF485 family)